MTDMLAWGVSSSVLILVILAVRALGKNRLSCRARYALWLLALVRLLVPVQLFTASWGVSTPPLPETLTEKQFAIPQRTRDAERTGLLTVIAPNPGSEPAGTTLPGAASLDGAPPGAAPEAAEARPAGESAARWSAADILRAVYFGGAGALALVLLVSNLRFTRRLRRTRVPYDALCGGMRVYVAEDLSSPCLVGVLRPSVYLTPEATRDERTLRHVLAHETTHRLHGDCVWSLLRLAALCLHWYNPLVWLAVVVSKRDGELACDERTLARLGEAERTAYGETLLSLVRAKPGTRELLSASTAMTAGKRPMRERIETIARHPRTRTAALLLALAVLLTATAVAFSRGAAKAADVPGTDAPGVNDPVNAHSLNLPDAYASVEDYLEHVRASAPDTMTYYTWGPDGAAPEPYEAVANVLDVRIDNLEKHGELPGLAPEGTLELYRYDMLYKMDVPVEQIMLIGGMTADGEYVAFEEANRTMVALRYPNGIVEVLLDQGSYDDMGGVWYYHNNAEEALHDWYVKENGLDMPLYTTNLLPYDELGNHPAHRVDGNGWYFYLPVQAWYRADDGETMRWYSQYYTGSALTVTWLNETIVDAAERYRSWGWTLTPGSVPRVEHTSGANGNVHTTIRFYSDVHDYKQSGCWQVLTQYDTDQLTDYPYIAQEPRVLEAMARSFTIDARVGAALFDPETGLSGFIKRLGDEKPVLTLSLFDPETGRYRGDYERVNDTALSYILEQCTFMPVNGTGAGGCVATVQALGCSLSFYDGNYVEFRPGDGTISCFLANGYDDLVPSVRMWYDETELRALGGGYGEQDRIVIPDRGQTYLEAAQEHCDTLLGVSLRVSPGSAFRYTWLKCVVEPAEEETEHFRKIGEIGENQWAFTMTELFVPENESAYHYGMAGNTLDYDEYIRDYAPEEYDPGVPEGACICWRVGYVTKEADGYHTRLVGTGW